MCSGTMVQPYFSRDYIQNSAHTQVSHSIQWSLHKKNKILRKVNSGNICPLEDKWHLALTWLNALTTIIKNNFIGTYSTPLASWDRKPMVWVAKYTISADAEDHGLPNFFCQPNHLIWIYLKYCMFMVL